MSVIDLKIHNIQNSPYPILVVESDLEFIRNIKSMCDIEQLLSKLDPDGAMQLSDCVFRGVEIERISCILSTGVDVEPTTAPIYSTDRFDKAVEYGGVPKVVMAFDPSYLDYTYREVPSSASLNEINTLKQIFPTEISVKEGSSLWLTKLAFDDPRASTYYEIEYSRWIPGNPFDALKAVIIFTDSLKAIGTALISPHTPSM
jgi:hypothetical protein